MVIAYPLVVSLFFFVAETFPDGVGSETWDIDALVARAQKGDRHAVGTLYNLYSQMIFRYVILRAPTSADAEDITANVFVSMVKALPDYQATGVPFEAWLYRIAASRVADFYRQSRRHFSSELPESLLDTGPLPEDDIQQQQTLSYLRNALQKLPDEQQNILILRFVERKSHEEVAQMLDKTVSSVKSAQYRALKRLTELLGINQKTRHYLRGNRSE